MKKKLFLIILVAINLYSSTVSFSVREKWEDMLKYVIYKNDGRAVTCKSKNINDKTYILCNYDLSNYNKKALFQIINVNLVYTVNGTSKHRMFTHYNEIVNSNSRQDVGKILDSFYYPN